MERGRREFSVVVVLHDSRDELAALLASSPPRPELIVVDTGRDDGGARARARARRQVIERRDNPGFGAANNAGLTHVTTGVTVLLNPDTELLDRDTLAGSRGSPANPPARSTPPGCSTRTAASSAPPTRSPGRSARSSPPPSTRRCSRAPQGARRAPPRHHAPHGRLGDRRLPGRRHPTLRRLGPFDPAIHLFAEDMDLGLRARTLGIPTVLHPELALRHTGGHAVQRGGEPYELLARRRRETVERTRGVRARTLDDAAQALTFATRIAARAALGRDASRERAQLAALRAGAAAATTRFPAMSTEVVAGPRRRRISTASLHRFARWPGDPQTYRNLLYLVLALPLGIAYVAILGAGLSAGAGLAVILIGLAILLATLFAIRGMAALERMLARRLLRVAIHPPIEGGIDLAWRERVPIWLRDPVTWKSLVYLLAKLPMGIVAGAGRRRSA